MSKKILLSSKFQKQWNKEVKYAVKLFNTKTGNEQSYAWGVITAFNGIHDMLINEKILFKQQNQNEVAKT